MDKFIQNHADLDDAVNQIKEKQFPYFISIYTGKPVNETDHAKWKRLNSFFHRGIVPTYSQCSGLMEDEAKADLQQRFALVEDHTEHILVESVSGMNLPRLSEFVQNCQIFLMREFTTQASELLESNRNKFFKIKMIKK
jgi:hypothetical protein